METRNGSIFNNEVQKALTEVRRENMLTSGAIVRHFKGNLYKVITIAEDTETQKQVVVYMALYGDFKNYVRDVDMFMSEVDHEKYPDVTQKYRFEYVPQVMLY